MVKSDDLTNDTKYGIRPFIFQGSEIFQVIMIITGTEENRLQLYFGNSLPLPRNNIHVVTAPWYFPA